MTTPDPAHCHLAYGLYVAFKLGQSQYTGTVYPTKSWKHLPDHHRERYRRRADRFRVRSHLRMPARLYLSWALIVPIESNRYIKPWDRVEDAGIHKLWWRVAEEYAAVTAEGQAAA